MEFAREFVRSLSRPLHSLNIVPRKFVRDSVNKPSITGHVQCKTEPLAAVNCVSNEKGDGWTDGLTEVHCLLSNYRLNRSTKPINFSNCVKRTGQPKTVSRYSNPHRQGPEVAGHLTCDHCPIQPTRKAAGARSPKPEAAGALHEVSDRSPYSGIARQEARSTREPRTPSARQGRREWNHKRFNYI